MFGDAVGRPRQCIKTAWGLTCKRAKITDLHFHDLRREAASRWMEAGASLMEIREMLGHHNISQTSTYLGAVSTDTGDIIRRLDQRRGRLPQVAASEVTNGPETVMRVKLFAEHHEFVTELEIPPFLTAPRVLMWGSRTFIREPNMDDVALAYTEWGAGCVALHAWLRGTP